MGKGFGSGSGSGCMRGCSSALAAGSAASRQPPLPTEPRRYRPHPLVFHSLLLPLLQFLRSRQHGSVQRLRSRKTRPGCENASAALACTRPATAGDVPSFVAAAAACWCGPSASFSFVIVQPFEKLMYNNLTNYGACAAHACHHTGWHPATAVLVRSKSLPHGFAAPCAARRRALWLAPLHHAVVMLSCTCPHNCTSLLLPACVVC